MSYDYTIENVIQIIYSKLIQENNSDGFDFELPNIDVSITKPYIDKDGDSSGNSIYFYTKLDNENIHYFIRLNDNKQSVITLYKLEGQKKFTDLDQNSPIQIQDLFHQIFTNCLKEIEELEKNKDAHIILLSNYAEQFKPHPIPAELEKLVEFQNQFPDYADGFFLRLERSYNFDGWCQEKDLKQEFAEQFHPIAVANGSGSVYAFWDNRKETELNKMPIIVFGDEGGIHIVSNNILELLQQLTCDIEISVGSDYVYFYKDEDDDELYESNYNDEYKLWLKQYFNLNAIDVDHANEIIEIAQKNNKQEFDTWLIKYLPNQSNENLINITPEDAWNNFTNITYENATRLHFQFRDKIALHEEVNDIWKTGFWENERYYSFHKNEQEQIIIHIIWYNEIEPTYEIEPHQSYSNFNMFRYSILSDDSYTIDFLEVYKNQFSERKIENSETDLIDTAKNEWRKSFEVVHVKYMECLTDSLKSTEQINNNLSQIEFLYSNKKIIFNGVEFSTLMPKEAHELLLQCKDFENDSIYNVLEDSWRFPLYQENAFFLVAENDVEIDSFSLDYSTEELPDAFILGFIFKKNLIANHFVIGFDMDNSPALIVLGNLTSNNIHLFGNIHYIAGNTVANTIWCKYNHGELFVKGEVNAQLIIEDDMYTHIGGINPNAILIGTRIRMNYLVAYQDGSSKYMEVSLMPTHFLKDVLDNELLNENYKLIEEGENKAIDRVLKNKTFLDSSKINVYKNFEQFVQTFLQIILAYPEMLNNNQLVYQNDYETFWIIRLDESNKKNISIGYRKIFDNNIIAALTFEEGSTNYELTLSYDQDDETNVAKMAIVNTIDKNTIEANMVRLAIIKTLNQLMDYIEENC